MRSFLRTLNSTSLTEAVLDRAVEIRSSDRLQLADAIIAACALAQRCILVTRNVDDFKRVNGLDILNPFE